MSKEFKYNINWHTLDCIKQSIAVSKYIENFGDAGELRKIWIAIKKWKTKPKVYKKLRVKLIYYI